MKKSIKFWVAMLFILTTLLSGCMVSGEEWVHGGSQSKEHGGDRGGNRESNEAH